MSLPNTLNALPVGAGMELLSAAIRGGRLTPPDNRLLRVNVPPSCAQCAAGVPLGGFGSNLWWWGRLINPRFQYEYLRYLGAIAACKVLSLEGATAKETEECNSRAATAFHAETGIWPGDYLSIPDEFLMPFGEIIFW